VWGEFAERVCRASLPSEFADRKISGTIEKTISMYFDISSIELIMARGSK
jgi:hypothetical protein